MSEGGALYKQIEEALFYKEDIPHISYGTAGFRTNSNLLDMAIFRCGILTVLRSAKLHNAAIGCCITASHNPEIDNGAKIVEPDGGMLEKSWETYAEELINAKDGMAYLCNLCQKELSIDLKAITTTLNFRNCPVVIGSDTRESSPRLLKRLHDGITACGGTVINIETVTTPQLHFTVWSITQTATQTNKPAILVANEVTHPSALEHYAKHFSTHVKNFVDAAHLGIKETCLIPKAYCDGACGIGSIRIPALIDAFASLGTTVEVRNIAGTPGTEVNKECGAEYCHKERLLPRSFGSDGNIPEQSTCFSLDGDADRLIFFNTGANGAIGTLIDGDRQAVLIACAIVDCLEKAFQAKCASTSTTSSLDESQALKIGVVQSAYANGGSTTFLQTWFGKLNEQFKGSCVFSVDIAKTGVKNLHHVAVEKDVGIYFESNGHGTALVKFEKLKIWATKIGVENTPGFLSLKTFLACINPAVGDAMTDALCFFAAARLLKYDVEKVWSLYPELAVVQAKIAMPRAKLNLIKSHPVHEKYLVSPTKLQEKIDEAVKAAGPANMQARAFVRASGTEDACRIYCEALEQNCASKLCKEIETILKNEE